MIMYTYIYIRTCYEHVYIYNVYIYIYTNICIYIYIMYIYIYIMYIYILCIYIYYTCIYLSCVYNVQLTRFTLNPEPWSKLCSFAMNTWDDTIHQKNWKSVGWYWFPYCGWLRNPNHQLIDSFYMFIPLFI